VTSAVQGKEVTPTSEKVKGGLLRPTQVEECTARARPTVRHAESSTSKPRESGEKANNAKNRQTEGGEAGHREGRYEEQAHL